MKKIFVALFVSAIAISVTSCTKDESYTITPCDHDGRTQVNETSRIQGVIVRKTVQIKDAATSESGSAEYEDRFYINTNTMGWNDPLRGKDLYPCNLPAEFQRSGMNVEFEANIYEQTTQESNNNIIPVSVTYIVEGEVIRTGGC